MGTPITAVLIGAGRRGVEIYGDYALKNKNKLKFVAVAEPIESRRKKFALLHEISKENCYKSWKSLLEKDKLADVAFICTQDQMHTQPTIKALEKGYDILLEKPMAHKLEDCVQIVKKVEETGRILGIGHVLRYTDFFSKIYRLIREGCIGDIVNITHRENIMWYHTAHSYVRGPWARSADSSPMILAKCCHDLDLLYWLTDDVPIKIQSFGNLLHFRQENAPEGAPEYCLNGCPAKSTCLYYAPRIYIDVIPILQIMLKSNNKFLKILAKLRKNHVKLLTYLSKFITPLKRLRYWRDFPIYYLYEDQKEDYSDESKTEILKNSPYGRCVYQCNNDVVDHQIVNIEFKKGVTANLTMNGFSEQEGRVIRIDGTQATIIGEFHESGELIKLYDFLSGKEKIIHQKKLALKSEENSGANPKLIDDFIKSLIKKKKRQPLTNARASLESHLMAFAAEESRLKNKVINMKDFREKAEKI
ncbi:MAG: Gfo/Idh/MocA family protein [Candidatus Hodarchaeota archaeon]